MCVTVSEIEDKTNYTHYFSHIKDYIFKIQLKISNVSCKMRISILSSNKSNASHLKDRMFETRIENFFMNIQNWISLDFHLYLVIFLGYWYHKLIIQFLFKLIILVLFETRSNPALLYRQSNKFHDPSCYLSHNFCSEKW